MPSFIQHIYRLFTQFVHMKFETNDIVCKQFKLMTLTDMTCHMVRAPADSTLLLEILYERGQLITELQALYRVR